ncbi:MAG: CBS domain-containing protein [Planctomycetales bacterium]|nr:CBS domain-containing protein [Planctomycetales bacterium]
MVSPSSTVGEVIELMRLQKGAAALVVEDAPDGSAGAKVAGIFTERDALKWLAEGQTLSSSIRDAMTPDPSMVTSDATVGETIEQMSQGGYRHLPIVTSSGVPTGVACVHGIVHYLVDHFPATIYTLPPEPGKSPTNREGA